MTEIRYAVQNDLHIAYSVEGNGPPDVVLVPNWLTDVESMMDVPVMGDQMARIASFGRIVNFDQPGTGHSDPVMGEMPSLETYVDAVRIVMDAADVQRATLLAWDMSLPAAIMFVAAHPERVAGIVTIDGTARWLADGDYPGIPADSIDATVGSLVAMWGKHDYARFLSPSASGDLEFCEAVARWLRIALSPGMVRRVFGMALRFDVRTLLGSVVCPVLLLQSSRALAGGRLAHAEYLAAHLPAAQLNVFDTADHVPYTRAHWDWMMNAIEEFVTGERPAATVEERVLATELFTDIVSSTERAARLGDAEWRNVLRRHDELVAKAVERYRGRTVKSTGDGTLATFDGPARAIRCARELVDAVGRLGLEIRAGVHTGELEVLGEDIGGIAVHIGARVQALAGPGEVLVSSTVKDLVVGSGIEFDDRGSHELKGVPGKWSIFAVRTD